MCNLDVCCMCFVCVHQCVRVCERQRESARVMERDGTFGHMHMSRRFTSLCESGSDQEELLRRLVEENQGQTLKESSSKQPLPNMCIYIYTQYIYNIYIIINIYLHTQIERNH